jgi:hypothetical protein
MKLNKKRVGCQLIEIFIDLKIDYDTIMNKQVIKVNVLNLYNSYIIFTKYLI